MSKEKFLKISDLDIFRKGFYNMHIMTINSCNSRCRYCYVFDKTMPMPSLQQFEMIISKLEDLNINNMFYDLSGGEIMLRPDWYEVLEKFLKTSRDVYVNTNGTLITTESALKIKELFEKYNKRLYLSVSLDSSNQEIHNKLRSHFQEAINGMKLLKGLNIRFRVSITLTSYNIDDVENTVRYIVKNLTNEIILGLLRPVFPINDFTSSLFVPLVKIRKVIKRIDDLSRQLKFILYHCLDEMGNPFCRAGIDRLAILVNGDIVPCYALQNKKNVVGNIFKDNIREIVQRLYINNKDRDQRILLCEHQEEIWGEPPLRVGK